MTETSTPADSLLLRHLRSLVGRAVTLERDSTTPIGRLVDVDAGHALIETSRGDLVLVALDGLDKVESGPGREAVLAHRRELHERYGERLLRANLGYGERQVLKMLEEGEGAAAGPAIRDPDGFLRSLTDAEREDDR